MKFYGLRCLGKVWLQRVDDVDDISHGGTVDEGRILYDESDERLYVANETEFKKITTPYDIFSAGTKVIFGSYPLPDGWTIDTSFEDRIIRTTNDSSEVGDIGGTWTIQGGLFDGLHDHNGRTGKPTDNTLTVGSSDLTYTTVTTTHTHEITADGLHTHSYGDTWRPYNAKLQVATYS